MQVCYELEMVAIEYASRVKLKLFFFKRKSILDCSIQVKQRRVLRAASPVLRGINEADNTRVSVVSNLINN